MSRPVLLLILLLVILVGGAFWLSGQVTERPRTQVEKSVSLENLS